MENNGECIIDELKLCYVSNQDRLSGLERVDVGEQIVYLGYHFYRLTNDRFRYFFVVFDEEGEVAQLKFGHYTEIANTLHFVYFKILNPILYQEERKQRVLKIPEMMGLSFNNFTALDLAFDTQTNITTLIKKMMRNKDVTTIFNGKAVTDRKDILQGITFQYSTTLNRLQYPSITLKQKKAINNKNEGIIVQAYDKKTEIEHSSEKQYILEHYGNPKRLFRLEVRLRYRELKDFFATHNIIPTPDVLQDVGLLEELFIYHLSAVIRFSQGRKKIQWKNLLGLHCQGVE